MNQLTTESPIKPESADNIKVQGLQSDNSEFRLEIEDVYDKILKKLIADPNIDKKVLLKRLLLGQEDVFQESISTQASSKFRSTAKGKKSNLSSAKKRKNLAMYATSDMSSRALDFSKLEKQKKSSIRACSPEMDDLRLLRQLDSVDNLTDEDMFNDLLKQTSDKLKKTLNKPSTMASGGAAGKK